MGLQRRVDRLSVSPSQSQHDGQVETTKTFEQDAISRPHTFHRECQSSEAVDFEYIDATLEEDKVRALEAGCADFATKPVDFPALLTVIATALDANT